MRPNQQETEDLGTFTKQILNEKLHLLCSDIRKIPFYNLRNYLLYPHQISTCPRSFLNAISKLLTAISLGKTMKLVSIYDDVITHRVKYAEIRVFSDPYFSLYTGKYGKPIFWHILPSFYSYSFFIADVRYLQQLYCINYNKLIQIHFILPRKVQEATKKQKISFSL